MNVETSKNIYFRAGGEKRRAHVGVFAGGEIHVRLPVLSTATHQVTITARLVDSATIMELLMTTDAIRRQCPDATISLVMKYIPYARQDRVCNEGEALAIKVFADLINSQNYKSVYVSDPHSDVASALINKVKIKSCVDILDAVGNLHEYDALVSPDAGAEKKTLAVARMKYGMRVVQASKVRDTKTGEILRTSVDGDPPPRVLIVDDICDGGRTFIELAKVLKEKGAITVDLYVTHGIFANGFDVLKEHIDHIYTTNSFYVAGNNEYVTVIH